MEKEIWKDIEGYNGRYQISNLGRVKYVKFFENYRRKGPFTKERIMEYKYIKHKRNRVIIYPSVRLFKSRYSKHEPTVESLMISHFLPKPNDGKELVYCDGNISNLALSNLYWALNSKILDDSWIKISKYLKLHCDKSKVMMTYDELVSSEEGTLLYEIIKRKFGGMKAVAAKLGFKVIDTRKFGNQDVNEWNEETVKQMCIKYFDGNVPTLTETKTVLGLQRGIAMIGGWKKLYKLLGKIPPLKRQYKTLDNEIVESTYEAIFSNYSFINGIGYKYNDLIWNDSDHRYDFLLKDIYGNNVYVEVWGMMGYKNYDSKRKMKEKMYLNSNKILMSIERKDIERKSVEYINNVLTKLMTTFNIKHDNFCPDINKIRDFYNQTEENWLKDIKNYCDDRQLRITPSEAELSEAGFTKYFYYLRENNFSTQRIADYLNLPSQSNPGDYYKDDLNVEWELQLLINKLDTFPTHRQIYTFLRGGISRKGMVYWSDHFGYIKEGDKYIKK
jgi:hypothetical protein